MNVLEFSHKYIICGNSYPWKVIFWKWILHFPFPNICSLCYIIIDLYKIDLSKCLIYPNNFRMKFSVSDHCDILQGAKGKKSWFIKWCLIVLLTRHRWIDSLCCQASFWSVPGLSTVVRRCDEISNFYVLIFQKVLIQKSCWNGGDGMLFVEKIEGRNSIVLLYDRTTSVRPKPRSNFGIGIGAELFFPKPKLFFFKFFSCFPLLVSFYKLENKPRSSKII